MQKGKINLVIDGQHGSTGKGLINSYIAWMERPEIISCTNMANAGHTAILPDEKTFVAKALPSSAILNGYEDYHPDVFVGAGAAFTIGQLLKEYEECGEPDLCIHPRAGVITEAHRLQEAEAKGGASTKHIASTMQGCGAFLADKIMRGADVKLARDYEDLHKFMPDDYPPTYLLDRLNNGDTILHEGSQGFSLGFNHGSHYPQCTSRECTALQSVTDMGLPHTVIGDIVMVVRPFPIRVGNVIEDGKQVGYSGDCYPDNAETSWDKVAQFAGAPEEVMKGELTTVTKRLRRVFTWSDIQFSQAVAVNGANKIALNFANYIDWECFGKNQWDDLGAKVHNWIKRLEDRHQIEVAFVGTGPRVDQVAVKP